MSYSCWYFRVVRALLFKYHASLIVLIFAAALLRDPENCT